jgi:hypothetical protein
MDRGPPRGAAKRDAIHHSAFVGVDAPASHIGETFPSLILFMAKSRSRGAVALKGKHTNSQSDFFGRALSRKSPSAALSNSGYQS